MRVTGVLLACAACEIRNILFVTGDPPKLGNYPQATGVFDAGKISRGEAPDPEIVGNDTIVVGVSNRRSVSRAVTAARRR